MSDDYTPTTDQVRDFWASDGRHQPAAKGYHFHEGTAEFDRWLADHDRQVSEKARRDALEEALAAVEGMDIWEAQLCAEPIRALIDAPRSKEAYVAFNRMMGDPIAALDALIPAVTPESESKAVFPPRYEMGREDSFNVRAAERTERIDGGF